MGDVLSFKCPCCTAALGFSGSTGEMTCEYCGASFTIDQARAAQEAEKQDAASSDMTWSAREDTIIRDETGKVSGYLCSSCGAEMVADENTAATECPYCGNNAIIHQSFDGLYRPDLVIPFSVDRQAAQEALKAYYRGKKLLPSAFTGRVENITGVYVPFWLMSCHAGGWAAYEGVKKKEWEDASFRYEKKDHYRVVRRGEMDFTRIPADASTKMDDATMDSLEPYDLSKAVAYDAAYFSGYLADRYDVKAEEVQQRASERVENTFLQKMQSAAREGYDTVEKKSQSVNLSDTRTEYAMLPVWMLSTTYEGKVYSFAMNAQSGKVAGELPIDKGKYWKFFAIAAAIALAVLQIPVYFLGGHRFPVGGEIAAVLVSLLVGFLYASSLKSAMKTIAQGHYAGSYLDEGSIRMGPKADLFLFSKTEKREKSGKQAAPQAAAVSAAAAPKPAAAAQKPAAQTQRPAAQTQRPATQTQRPAAQTQRPAAQTQRPAAQTQRPAAQTQRPAAQTQKPATQTQRPATQTQRPAAQTQRPAAQTQRPAAQTQNPAAQTQRPAAQTQKPAAQTQRPATQAQRPATQTQKTTTQSPGQAQRPGAPTIARPNTTQTRPAPQNKNPGNRPANPNQDK